MRTLAKVVGLLAGLFYLTFGIWAFAAPESFYADIATYPPFNEHFMHDLGSFQIGLGVAALAGLLLSDALAAVLAGAAAGSLMHGLSHIMDHGLGGRPSDPWTVTLVGIAILCAFALALRRKGSRSR
ncbi:MAG TPA: hypothetical protein VGX25_30840 [Actinophytocola sp.]|uniref:hypothetical protein n=1 Tax=Actinophytocola sp. TaxID=1872138 RepID=UPI002DDCFEA3|nr:hypothetical protein [Actinophytocola sp.]HEV2783806.1 hypothetical protein [Actinophytocola sp.]